MSKKNRLQKLEDKIAPKFTVILDDGSFSFDRALTAGEERRVKKCKIDKFTF